MSDLFLGNWQWLTSGLEGPPETPLWLLVSNRRVKDTFQVRVVRLPPVEAQQPIPTASVGLEFGEF